MNSIKKKNLLSSISRDILNFLSKLINYYKLKNRFKGCFIKYPIEIKFSDINNIHISKNVVISSNIVLRIFNNCTLFIEEGTYIGPNCHIAGTKNNIKIGRDVLISDRVFISTTEHRYEDVTKPINQQGFISKGDIIIGDECLIGTGSAILTGVKIGKHSIIGANSVVTRDISSYSVAVGNPARVIKRYNFKTTKWVRVEK